MSIPAELAVPRRGVFQKAVREHDRFFGLHGVEFMHDVFVQAFMRSAPHAPPATVCRRQS
jgi:hypothetical protein